MDPQLDFYKQMLDHLAEGVYFVDRDRRILYWNRAAEMITGYKADEVSGSHCHDGILNHVDENLKELCTDRCPLTAAMENGSQVCERAFLHHRDGHRLPVQVKAQAITNAAGEVIGAVEIFSDATSYLQLETLNAKLQQQIRIDPLTRVPNRRAFYEVVDQELERFRRYGTPFSVIFTDIDFFKEVNDRHGHKTGDLTLQWFAQTLQSELRKVDTVSRFGGEEFLILLPATPSKDAVLTAEKLRARIASNPCPETGEPLTASFGVAAITLNDNGESLVERADRGLYRSKKEGRNRVTYLDPSSEHPVNPDCEQPPADSSRPTADPEQ